MSRLALPSPLLWAAAGALAVHWALMKGLGDLPAQPHQAGEASASSMLTRQIIIAPP